MTTPERLNYSHLVESSLASAGADPSARNLASESISISFWEIDSKGVVTSKGKFAPHTPMVPASIVKLFYLVALQHDFSTGKLHRTHELERAMRDMIRDSSNDATSLVVDTLTETTGGPELSEAELRDWMARRNRVNLWFKLLGFTDINVNQKTWNEAPYGRERQGYGPNFELRNSLNTHACNELWYRLLSGSLLPPVELEATLDLLRRSVPVDDESADYQSRAFIGKALPSGATLYSKAGYITTERHDSAYIVMPDHRRFILTVFTRGFGDNLELIPQLAGACFRAVGYESPLLSRGSDFETK